MQPRLQAVVELCASADVPVKISPDVMAELWSKLMVNCAYNAISGLAQLPYGVMAGRKGVQNKGELVERAGNPLAPTAPFTTMLVGSAGIAYRF